VTEEPKPKLKIIIFVEGGGGGVRTHTDEWFVFKRFRCFGKLLLVYSCLSVRPHGTNPTG